MVHRIEIGRATFGTPPRTRRAVKAVAQRGDQLLLMHSPTAGAYKFAGGGVRAGESDEEALAREVREECGRAVLRLGPVLVHVVETHPDRVDPGADFQMVSAYYECSVSEQLCAQDLGAYERALGLVPTWVKVAEALSVNDRVSRSAEAAEWVVREVAVLRWLNDQGRRLGGGAASPPRDVRHSVAP